MPEYTDEGLAILKEVIREEGLKVNPDFNLLSEISLHGKRNKYKTSWFAPRQSGSRANFMNKLEDEGLPKPEGRMIVVDEVPADAIAVDISTSDRNDYKIALQDEEGKTYDVTYSSKGALNSSFVSGGKDPNQISWKASTYETAACVGLALENEGYDPNELLEQVQQASSSAEVREIVDSIVSVLENGTYDWDSDGASEIITKLNGEPLMTDLAQLMALAWGTWNFWNEEISQYISTPYFVLGSIKSYYQAEENNENLELGGIKANTTDFVVCGEPDVSKFIERVRSEPITYEDGTAYFAGSPDDRFVQVSHKKRIEPGGAQLGKVKSAFADVFGLEDKDNFLSTVVTITGDDAIEEGFVSDVLDKARAAKNKAVNMISGGFQAFKDKFIGGLKNLTSKVKTAFKASIVKNFRDTGETEQVLSKVISNARREGMVLNEATQDQIVNALVRFWNSSPKSKVSKVFSPLYQGLRSKKSRLDQIVDQSPSYDYYQNTVTDFKPPAEVDVDVINNLFATNQALGAFLRIVSDESGTVKEAEQTLRQFIQIEKEMFFGKTQLPVWKVGQERYSLLGAGETFQDERLNFIASRDVSEVPVVLFRVDDEGLKSGTRGAYATTYMAMVDDFEDEFLYTIFKFRSKGDLLQFTIEGSKKGVTLSQLKG
jgi:hypothetical protein